MMLYTPEMVMALHKAKVVDGPRNPMPRRLRRRKAPAATGQVVPLRPAVAR